MRIGLIGAGAVAQAFAQKAVTAGHSVVFSSSREPESLKAVTDPFGGAATAARPREVVDNPVVVLALPWGKVETVLTSLPGWNGQVLIDATNAFTADHSALIDLGRTTSSEIVASLAPGARVIKAMNHLYMTNFTVDPVRGNLRRVLFLAGDDPEAKTTAGDLFESFGFAPIDLGSLATGGAIQSVNAPIAGHDFFVPWPAPRSLSHTSATS
jgi:8-hydroxy-5-deazaflavin:NADPH oxidoreductase